MKNNKLIYKGKLKIKNNHNLFSLRKLTDFGLSDVTYIYINTKFK